ncbi:hypothetical protein JYU34_018262 [Plutella xylostella]|uniref:Translation initiation factor eIF2B subunit beta n=1 Tax=Plutella xylostella TaxID=51655 RepID=A0ABQ7Q077_PLUXY|nr:translation initiation factor eIF-2B subunit beta [Plutella xylostella]KAG7298612.1 hypothetical protein JYU34_018262 [Plutella xylostella]
MSPLSGPPVELGEKHAELVVKFVANIRNSKPDSRNVALATITLLEQIISDSNSATAYELCTLVRGVGRAVGRALPQQLVAGNIVRRVLRAVRDEYRNQADQSVEGATSSLQRLVLGAGARRATLPRSAPELDNLRDHIAELRLELETSSSAISQQARQHAHTDELILTYGASDLAERWLKQANSRRYRLILAESSDVRGSAAMAARLSAAGVPVTLVNSASVTGLMSRVNKVVLGVSAVLAGGAARAAAGAHAVTLAAKHYSVPVIALAPLYKLSPLHACSQTPAAALASPHRALSYEYAESAVCRPYAPLHDSIPPDHITLFITNLGGSSPSYIYRLLSELYDPNDYEL